MGILIDDLLLVRGDLYREYKNTEHGRHGWAFDRGMADSYYHRPRDPHIWRDGTYKGTRTERDEMTDDEIDAYHAGYAWNEEHGDKKSWD
jgi:hypothetical protein